MRDSLGLECSGVLRSAPEAECSGVLPTAPKHFEKTPSDGHEPSSPSSTPPRVDPRRPAPTPVQPERERLARRISSMPGRRRGTFDTAAGVYVSDPSATTVRDLDPQYLLARAGGDFSSVSKAQRLLTRRAGYVDTSNAGRTHVSGVRMSPDIR